MKKDSLLKEIEALRSKLGLVDQIDLGGLKKDELQSLYHGLVADLKKREEQAIKLEESKEIKEQKAIKLKGPRYTIAEGKTLKIDGRVFNSKDPIRASQIKLGQPMIDQFIKQEVIVKNY